MKTLIVFAIIFSFQSHACMNRIPLSEAVKAINLEPNAGSKTCQDLPKEDCVCFDGIEWETAEIVDETYEAPTYAAGKVNATACETEKACEEHRPTLCKDLKGEHHFFYAENLILSGYEAYCAKVSGTRQVKTGNKLLKTNQDKKTARKAQKEAEKLAREERKAKKKAAKEALKEVDIDSITTVKALREVVKQLLEAQKED